MYGSKETQGLGGRSSTLKGVTTEITSYSLSLVSRPEYFFIIHSSDNFIIVCTIPVFSGYHVKVLSLIYENNKCCCQTSTW